MEINRKLSLFFVYGNKGYVRENIPFCCDDRSLK